MKYRASGTVDHISMKGPKVRRLGHQENPAWTSPNGLRLVVIMTYSGSSTNRRRPTSTTTRKTFFRRVSPMGGLLPPLGEVQVQQGHEQQEQQQQHAHGAARDEVPGQERGVVYVEADEVARRGLGGAEQDVRG